MSILLAAGRYIGIRGNAYEACERGLILSGFKGSARFLDQRCIGRNSTGGQLVSLRDVKLHRTMLSNVLRHHFIDNDRLFQHMNYVGFTEPDVSHVPSFSDTWHVSGLYGEYRPGCVLCR